MTSRNLILIGAAALTLGLSAATLATAAPDEPQRGTVLRVSPPSSNPHDVFRTVTRVPAKLERAEDKATATCDCPMMRGDAATADMCMSMTPPKG